jgi:hypothetical protein
LIAEAISEGCHCCVHNSNTSPNPILNYVKENHNYFKNYKYVKGELNVGWGASALSNFEEILD